MFPYERYISSIFMIITWYISFVQNYLWITKIMKENESIYYLVTYKQEIMLSDKKNMATNKIEVMKQISYTAEN